MSTAAVPPGAPAVGIVMGSRSDWETMQHAAQKLDALGVPHEQAQQMREPLSGGRDLHWPRVPVV